MRPRLRRRRPAETTGVDGTGTALRLNLGCGFDHRLGFVDVDLFAFHRPDVVADVRHLPFRPTPGFVEILAHDLLEHLERADTDVCLAEWARYLAEDGTLWLKLPDLRGLARTVLSSATTDDHELIAQLYYGTQAYGGDYHRAGFTDLMLVSRLATVGLTARLITQVDGWMLSAEVVPSAGCAVSLGLTDGFHQREDGGPALRVWASDDAVIRLINPGDETVTATFVAGLESHSGQRPTARLGRDGAVVAEAQAGRSSRLEAVLTVPPGLSEWHLTSDAQRIDPATDPRDLRVALLDPRVDVSSS